MKGDRNADDRSSWVVGDIEGSDERHGETGFESVG